MWGRTEIQQRAAAEWNRSFVFSYGCDAGVSSWCWYTEYVKKRSSVVVQSSLSKSVYTCSRVIWCVLLYSVVLRQVRTRSVNSRGQVIRLWINSVAGSESSACFRIADVSCWGFFQTEFSLKESLGGRFQVCTPSGDWGGVLPSVGNQSKRIDFTLIQIQTKYQVWNDSWRFFRLEFIICKKVSRYFLLMSFA